MPDPRPQRADARRNQERILQAAATAIAHQGATASLEEIARQAGVGSATLHRHFPTRQSLLEAVFRTHVETLCTTAIPTRPGAKSSAHGGADEPDSGGARSVGGDSGGTRSAAGTRSAGGAGDVLVGWLHAVVAHAVTNRGLAAAVFHGVDDADPSLGPSCHTLILKTGARLLDEAQNAGEIRPDVPIADLLSLAGAIASFIEGAPNGAAEANRLLNLALDGIHTKPA